MVQSTITERKRIYSAFSKAEQNMKVALEARKGEIKVGTVTSCTSQTQEITSCYRDDIPGSLWRSGESTRILRCRERSKVEGRLDQGPTACSDQDEDFERDQRQATR